MTLFYCEECEATENRESDEGWDCARCGDPMDRYVLVTASAEETEEAA